MRLNTFKDNRSSHFRASFYYQALDARVNFMPVVRWYFIGKLYFPISHRFAE